MRKTIVYCVVIALTIFGFVKAMQYGERFSCDGSTIVAQKGDNVWNIMLEHCTGNREVARDSIIEQLGSANLQPGQTFTLPGK